MEATVFIDIFFTSLALIVVFVVVGVFVARQLKKPDREQGNG